MVLAGAMLLIACGEGDDCDPSENWCEGNVLYACTAGGGARVGAECPAGTACAGTRCYPEPLEECGKGIESSWRACDPSRTRPGTCMEDGYMLWDDGAPCRTEIGETCLRVLVSVDDPAGEALCGYSGALCNPKTMSCHNQVLLSCNELGVWVTERDCRADGMVCSNKKCQ